MKKSLQKNQIIITAMAIMIAVAGYVHFSKEDASQIEELAAAGEAVTDESPAPVNTSVSTTIEQLSVQEIENNTKNKEKKDSDENRDKDSDTGAKSDDKDDKSITDTIGEAVLVNASVNTEFFYSAKLSREQVRAKNKESLMEIINSDKADKKAKEKAYDEIVAITKYAEMENDIETLLEAKGYENCIANVGEENADVVVDVAKISSKDAAVIEDVVRRKTGLEGGNIAITPANAQ